MRRASGVARVWKQGGGICRSSLPLWSCGPLPRFVRIRQVFRCVPLAVPLLLTVGCGQQPSRHPRADALVHASPPALSVELPALGDDEPATSPLTSDTSRSGAVIGTVGGSSSTVLGRVVGVARVGEQIGVLDALTKTLRVFDTDGKPLYNLGADGHGPGEFISPRSVQALGGRAFIVFDGAGRVTRFDAQDGASPETLLQFDGLLEGGCVLGNDIYIHGLRPGDDRVVHRYDLGGRYRGSFGEMYRTESRIVLMHVALGRIACVPTQGQEIVAVLPALLPELRAYTADGSLRWWIDFRSFTPIELKEIQRGVTMREPCGESNTWAGLATSRLGSVLFVQVLHTIWDCQRDSLRSHISTLAVSTAGPDARWEPLRPDEAIVYSDDDYMITTAEDPVPQVFLRPRRTS